MHILDISKFENWRVVLKVWLPLKHCKFLGRLPKFFRYSVDILYVFVLNGIFICFVFAPTSRIGKYTASKTPIDENKYYFS